MPVAANCCEPVVRMEGFAGVKIIVVSAGGGGSTVNSAGALLTPWADASTAPVPWHRPVANPAFRLMQLLFVVQPKLMPDIGLLY